MSFFRLVQAVQWPRPLVLFVLAAITALLGAAWRPFLFVAIGIWMLLAAWSVLDARARGRRGIVAGLLAAAGGPLAAAVIARLTRTHVRKAGPHLAASLPYAVAAALAGARTQAGDRLVVSPILGGDPSRGEIVAVGPFPAADAVLGRSRRVIALGRVVGLAGEWVGATEEGDLYFCLQPPDIIEAVAADTPGCVFPDETAYLTSTTAPFGPVETPAESVFVLADDRATMDDSRTLGPIPIDALAGHIVATVWPPGRIAIH
jgi:signal peptidase I